MRRVTRGLALVLIALSFGLAGCTNWYAIHDLKRGDVHVLKGDEFDWVVPMHPVDTAEARKAIHGKQGLVFRCQDPVYYGLIPYSDSGYYLAPGEFVVTFAGRHISRPTWPAQTRHKPDMFWGPDETTEAP